MWTDEQAKKLRPWFQVTFIILAAAMAFDLYAIWKLWPGLWVP